MSILLGSCVTNQICFSLISNSNFHKIHVHVQTFLIKKKFESKEKTPESVCYLTTDVCTQPENYIDFNVHQ